MKDRIDSKKNMPRDNTQESPCALETNHPTFFRRKSDAPSDATPMPEGGLHHDCCIIL